MGVYGFGYRTTEVDLPVGVIWAWTVEYWYRGSGVGRGLLEEGCWGL
jgi:hypothetical protein